MNCTFLKELISLAENFETENRNALYPADINGFMYWIAAMQNKKNNPGSCEWEGRDNGRSAESVINTLLVHMNRYAKTYSKAAIAGSHFSTQEEFIYLINLKAFGSMTKMDLVKKNIHEKPAGMQIINRLLAQGWIRQTSSSTDKRSKVIEITRSGLSALNRQMDKIREATKIVTGDLSEAEKMELIYLLTRLDHFHKPIYLRNIKSTELLDTVRQDYMN